MQWHTGGNAGETPAGSSGGIAMYDYTVAVPAPFTAGAGTTYWVQIEALHGGIPNWGLAAGAGGNNKHFRGVANAGDIFYQLAPGDVAFALLGPPPPTYIVSGQVLDDGGQPLAGVVVSAGGTYRVTTGADGTYTITDLLAGTYTIRPSLVGYTFSPATLAVSVPPSATGRVFTGTLTTRYTLYLPLILHS